MKDDNKTTEGKLPLTQNQKEKMKKYSVFALMFIIFGASMWLIFAPSKDKNVKTGASGGFNTDIPLPKEEGIIGDKKSAYEEEQIKQKQEEKMRSMQDFAVMLGDGGKDRAAKSLSLTENGPKTTAPQPGYSSSRPQSSIQTSAAAYHDINRTLGTFYDSPKEDPEKERLTRELEELKSKLADNETRENAINEQIAIMEKSYQIAARYMPQVQEQTYLLPAEDQSRNASGKAAVAAVKQVNRCVVSRLQQDVSSDDIEETFSQPRNLGFLTITASDFQETKNTINACIHENQTVVNGQNIRLRLLEEMQAGRIIIPRNTVITGATQIQGERLQVIVSSLEFSGVILPVELTVYDTDGQPGIFIPNTKEINAAKEIIANMGTNAGTSISLTSDAGQQLAADLGRSLIQGTSQYASKKLREVKVNLKAGYRVFLMPNEKK